MKQLVLGVLLLTGSLAAQPREMFPWWETPIVRDLNLSDDQMKQIQNIVKENRDRLVDLRAAVEKADNGLHDLMADDHPDPARFNAALERQIAARGDLTRAFAQMGFKLRMVLTPPQWQELQKRGSRPLRDDQKRGGKKGGHGKDGPRDGGREGPPPREQDRPPGD